MYLLVVDPSTYSHPADQVKYNEHVTEMLEETLAISFKFWKNFCKNKVKITANLENYLYATLHGTYYCWLIIGLTEQQPLALQQSSNEELSTSFVK